MSLDMENEEGCGGCSMGRAEIDTRAPFRSVKEAVMIFGEKVLAGEVYAPKLNQIRAAAICRDENHATPMSALLAELEETKQKLEKAREESQIMARCLASLKEELEKTKTELVHLKSRQSRKQAAVDDSDTEDLKFVEDAPEVEILMESRDDQLNSPGREFEKKRSVKFATPPSLTQIINPDQEQVLERQFSVDRGTTFTAQTMKTKKKKKMQLMPLIASIFSKKKGYRDGSSAHASGSRTLVQEVSYA